MTASERSPRRSVILAVTSGKGGVGKTNVVVNLAVALSRLRQSVAILDADFGLGNVDVLLGLSPSVHIGSVLSGASTIDDVLVDGPFGVKVIPSSSGVRSLTALSGLQWDRLCGALEAAAERVDFLIIDTAPGISDNVIDLVGLAERVLVVTAVEPTAVVDAYAVIKLISASSPLREIGLLINNCRDASDAELVFAQLEVTVKRFLKRRLTYYGFIPHDPAVGEAVLMQRPVVDHLPQCGASRSFRILATKLAGVPAEERTLRLVPKRLTVVASGAPQCV